MSDQRQLWQEQIERENHPDAVLPEYKVSLNILPALKRIWQWILGAANK
jgi:hypothetical protein